MKEKQPNQDQDNQAMQEPMANTALESNEPEKVPTSPAQDIPELEAALAAANDKYVRLYAEFDNFRRRAAKEKLTLLETATQEILKQLLVIVDDFERAMAVIDQHKQGDAQAMEQGVQLIHDKLMHLLQQAGVQPMEISPGSSFDAELHEAVTQTPVEEPLKGKIVEVLEKGYFLKQKALRFAKVVIGA